VRTRKPRPRLFEGRGTFMFARESDAGKAETAGK